MNLCLVTGDVVSTVKNERLVGHKILTVQPVDPDGKTPRGSSFLAVDLVGELREHLLGMLYWIRSSVQEPWARYASPLHGNSSASS